MNGKVFRTMLAIIPVFMKRIIYIFIYIYIFHNLLFFKFIFIQSSETISFGHRS